MVIFSKTQAQLNIPEIEEVEKMAGLIFPVEYKDHLLKFNGGKCSPCDFVFIENGKSTSSYIDKFLAIYSGKYDNLIDYIQIYKIEEKRLPTHILPIANDLGGNLICISCGCSDNGYVYFWDHETEVDYSNSDDADYSNLYLIAKSFSEFMDGLK